MTAHGEGIQRYSVGILRFGPFREIGGTKDADGQWVKYDDIAPIEEENRRLREERDQLRADLCAATMEAESLPAQSAFDQVKAERDAALAQVPQWIPASERTPPEEQRVLVMVLGMEYIGTHTRHGWVVDGYLRSGTQEPTHWMSLPKGPTS